jgi:hypothetical protein
MTIYERPTALTPTEVIDRARAFFAHAGSPYAAFTEAAGGGYICLHLEVGEIVIGTLPMKGSTLVRGSASRGGHLLTRFLTTLGDPMDVSETTHRRGYQDHRGL